MKAWQKKLIKIVSPLLKNLDPAHGSDHSERVFKYCLIFTKNYREVDLEALFAASWLHDIGQLKLKNRKGLHGHLSAGLANSLLKKARVPKEKFNLIKKIIELHEKRNLSSKKLPTEVLIFHDADKIEGVGALGLARQFTYSGGVGKKIWNPNIPRKPGLSHGGNYSAMHTILDWDIKKKFFTKKGKKMAEERKEYMKSFIKRFFQEWNFRK